jgi:hypothetical protein
VIAARTLAQFFADSEAEAAEQKVVPIGHAATAKEVA